MLSRIFWGIFGKKVKVYTSFCSHQTGFVLEAGCYNNIQMLRKVLHAAKAGDSFMLIHIYVSKAFDTVPHEAIRPALRVMRLPEMVMRLVE